jgi:hypothetical protein
MKPVSDRLCSSPKPPDVDRWRAWLLAGMTALFVARALYPTESAAMEGDGLPAVMLWLAICVLWLLGAIGRQRIRVRLGWTSAAVLAVVVLHTIASLTAMGLSRRPAVNMLWEWVGMGTAFFLARQFIVSSREARAVVAAMLATGAALAAEGLYQSMYEFPKMRAEYAADPEAVLRDVGLRMTPGSPERMRFESRLQNNEPLANFALTNTLAGYLAPWLVVGVGIVVAGGGWRVAGGATVMAVCLALTRSRSGYVAAVVGVLLTWFLCRKERRALGLRRAMGVVGVVVLLAAVATVCNGRWAERAVRSFGYRVQYWQSTVGMIADHPVWGVGPGNFQNEYTRYKLPGASEEVADPHNFLLEIAATAGIPAGLAFLAVLATFGVAAGRVRRGGSLSSTQSDYSRFVVGGGLAGFLLAIPLSMISIGRVEMATLVVGLPVAAVCLVVMWRWIERGELAGGVAGAGIAALVVHLTTTGGIGFPGVGGTLWLLLAVGLNQSATDRPRWMSRRVAAVVLVLAMMILGACYLTGYGPVMYCKADLRRAQGDLTRIEQHLLAGGADDPWEVRPWNQLALNAFADWERDGDDERLAQFEAYSAEGLRRDPHASPAWMHLAECRMKVFERTGRRDYLGKAIEAYRMAVELYPNNGAYRGRLALALQAEGDEAGYRREADRALALDDLTFHADKKLAAELRRRLIRSNAQPE